MKNLISVFVIFFLFSSTPHFAWASNSLSTINSFGPGSSQVNFVSVESARTLDYKKFSILGFLDTSYQSLAIYNSTQSGDDIVSFTHLGLSYGLSPKLEIGVKGPVVFNQTSASSQSSIVLTARGFVNIDGFVKYKLTDNIKSGLSLMAQVGMSNGDELFYVGPGSGLNYSLSALYQRSLGRWLLATNIGYILRNPGEQQSLAFFEPIKSTIIGSVGLGRPISQSTRISGELLVASHDITKDNSDRGSLSAEALLSFHTKVKALNFSYGLGGGLTNGVSTPTVRGFLGFQYPFGFPNQVAKKEEPAVEEVAAAEPEAPVEAPLALDPPRVIAEEAPAEAPVMEEPVAEEPVAEEPTVQELAVAENTVTEEKLEEVLQTENAAPAPLVQKEFLIDDIVFIEEAKPEAAAAPTENSSANQKIVLNNIDFDFNSAQLTRSSKQILDNVLSHIAKNDYKSLEIWGHTDFYGPSMYNEYLGLRRAKAVHDYFKKAGVSIKTMNYDAFGERRPVSVGLEDEDRRKNRRVEIIVIRN